MNAVPLPEVDAVDVTVLMDNVSDALLADTGPARRAPLAGARRAVPTFAGGEGPDALRAEHGFSALVTVTAGGASRTILFDAGVSVDGVVDNMRRLDIDARDTEAVVLSHGHFDHTAGMAGFVQAVGRANLPVIVHPEFWSRRRIAIPSRDPFELPSTSRAALEGAGFTVVEDAQPSFLLGDALLVTGEVDRTTSFERGFPVHQAYRDGGWQPDPLILDDQAVVANVRGKGLVVITGCGHSGVVNIVRHVRRLTGTDRLHAVMGGFHLTGPLFDPVISETVDALAGFSPDVVVPAHCTGWKAVHAIARRLPDAFIAPSVGTRFEFRT